MLPEGNSPLEDSAYVLDSYALLAYLEAETGADYVKKSAAERAAARFFGVRAVAKEMQVRLPGSLERSDEDIAGAVASVLEWNVLVSYDRVKVQVQNGLVTLSGEVDWWYQKYATQHGKYATILQCNQGRKRNLFGLHGMVRRIWPK